MTKLCIALVVLIAGCASLRPPSADLRTGEPRVGDPAGEILEIDGKPVSAGQMPIALASGRRHTITVRCFVGTGETVEQLSSIFVAGGSYEFRCNGRRQGHGRIWVLPRQ